MNNRVLRHIHTRSILQSHHLSLHHVPMTLASSVFSSSSTESRRCVSTTGFREDELKPGADKPDFYRILGINRNASIDQIKVAFREKGA